MLLTFLSFLGLAGNVALSVLQSTGVVSASTTTLATDLLAGVQPLIAAIASGGSKVSDVLAALAGLSATIGVLQKDTSLPADKLAQINSLDQDIQAAVVAFLQAQKGIDLSVLTIIPNV